MALFIQLFILVAGFALLIKGADFFVDGASKIAGKFKIPQIVIGLTIVAFGTSAPEAAISINSAIHNNAGISIGNVLGSNIMNVLLILGITALIRNMKIKTTTFKYETPFVILITVVLLLLGLTGNNLTKIDGIILLVFMVLFCVYLFFLSKKGENDAASEVPELKSTDTLPKLIILTVLGLAAIVIGSDLTVKSATEIATFFGVDSRIIGLTVVAFGTSLPELITSVTAARKGNADIAVGNILGSNIFNILFVLGLASVISPSPLAFSQSFIFDAIVAIATMVLLLVLMIPKKMLSKPSGFIMLASYAAYFTLLIIKK